MPELPEVEVVRSALDGILPGERLQNISYHSPKLRYPLDPEDAFILTGQRLLRIERIAKYMLWSFEHDSYLLHLGMSGHVRWADPEEALRKHDHIIWDFETRSLRLNDPRRFGSWMRYDTAWQKKMASFGPDPLSTWQPLAWQQSHIHSPRGIYSLLMDQHILAGIGNIYAQEALFLSRIHPCCPLASIPPEAMLHLADNLRSILKKSIASGGTTLQDHRQTNGNSGYFQVQLSVYGKTGQACNLCSTPLEKITLQQRSVTLCPECQILPPIH